jgi:hypothetical protein
MNVNQLINMGMRMLMRKGMSKGVALMANKGKRPEDMTPEERAQAKNAQQTAQKAQRGLNAGSMPHGGLCASTRSQIRSGTADHFD